MQVLRLALLFVVAMAALAQDGKIEQVSENLVADGSETAVVFHLADELAMSKEDAAMCEGNLWAYDADRQEFACIDPEVMEIDEDRARVLRTQRDFHFQSSILYRTQRDACQADLKSKTDSFRMETQARALALAMSNAQDEARAKCRALGKKFNDTEVQCSEEPLPQPEE